MIEAQDELAHARELMSARRWSQAHEAYFAADRGGRLDADALQEWGEVAYWAGELEAAIEARERAFAMRAADGQKRKAARDAMVLGKYHGDSLRPAVAAAWRAKAERMLEGEGDCPERVELLGRQAARAFTNADYETAEAIARQALEIASRQPAPGGEAYARHVLGQVLLYRGEIAAGFELIDEATAAATAGELPPMVAGTIYCWTISVCRDVADVRRAAEWTQVASRWCEREGITGIPGICRIHRSELQRLHGAFAEAEAQAVEAARELERHSPRMAADAFAELAEVRLARGTLEAAGEAIARALELGGEAQPVRSLLTLRRGDAGTALRQLQEAFRAEPDRLLRGRMLPALVEIAVAARDLEAASAASAELQLLASEYGSELHRAQASFAEGLVAGSEGNHAGAIPAYRSAMRHYRALNAPFEYAQAQLALARVQLAMGEQQAAADEAQAALSTFERLGTRLAAAEARRVLEGCLAQRSASERVERTFMFTDIVRSTSLLEALGDEAWAELLRWHDRALRETFSSHGGEEVDHAGDGFLVSFETPGQALDCATAIQQLLAAHRRDAGFAPRVRIGIHQGTAQRSGSGYRGRAVHQAARIAALAGADEILVSCSTFVDARPEGAPECVRVEQLRGISQPIELTTISWR